jgi:hypothetical protein
MRHFAVRQIGDSRPWYQFGLTDPFRADEIVHQQCDLQERDPGLQEVQIDFKGHWWPLIEEPDEKVILARMVAKLKSVEPASARLDAVDDLIELGHTTPEAWKLAWDAMPVEAADRT